MNLFKVSVNIIVVVGLLLLGLYEVKHHQTTRKYTSGNTTVELTPRSSEKHPWISALLQEAEREFSRGHHDHVYEGLENVCLKNRSGVTNPQEQLQNFIEGPCSPIVVVPGIFASKLLVTIDCPTMRDESPELFKACGWDTCSRTFFGLWGSRPAHEYWLWIPELFSPMSFVENTEDDCFGGLISLWYNKNETDPHDKYTDSKGVNVTYYGNTPKTYDEIDGGWRAISNLAPFLVQAASTKNYHAIEDQLILMGYQKGLTMLGLPYDYRRTPVGNENAFQFARAIKYAYELSGKKVVLVAHSNGNLNALAQLNRMEQADKEKMIHEYIAVAPPFAGAAKAARIYLGGDQDFVFFAGIGIGFKGQKKLYGTAPTGVDLLPKDLFFRFADEPWMKDLLKRVELEEQYPVKSPQGKKYWETVNANKLPFSWFPTPLQNCSQGFSGRPDECTLGIVDYKKTPWVEVLGKQFYANETGILDMFKAHYTFTKDFAEVYKDVLSYGSREFINPGVPVALIYGSHVATETTYKWNYNPSPVTEAGKFAWPTVRTYKYGDATVGSTFSLTPAMKWAWEFDNNKTNAKPVKIIEYCSIKNVRDDIYDGVDANGVKTIFKNEYLGVGCSCFRKPGEKARVAGDDCNHSSMLNDKELVKLIANAVVTNAANPNYLATAAWRYNLTAIDLHDLADNSPFLTAKKNDTDPTAWFMRYRAGDVVEPTPTPEL